MDFDDIFLLETIVSTISDKLGIPNRQIHSTIALLKEDNSIPFIARYRKDQTGNLDEIKLRDIKHEWDYLNSLNDLKKQVYSNIDEQKKLTPILIDQLTRAKTISEVNDLYAPFKRVRKTKADIAKENGLEPLAEKILNLDKNPLEELITPFLNPKVPDNATALQGVVEILSDQIGHDIDIKNDIKEVIRESGTIQVKISEEISPTDEKAQVYKDYFDYREEIKSVAPHRILAINRAIKEGILDKRIDTDLREDIINNLKKKFIPESETPEELPESAICVSKSISHAYTRYLAPSAKATIWLEARENAFKDAISIFAKNIENLLLTPPVKGHTILGLDPAYRTGCKTAIVNSQGKLISTDTLYLHDKNSEKKDNDIKKLNQLISENGISLVAIGDGTASRETEEIVVSSTARQEGNIPYLIVSESGASVYSASKLAAEEFPDLDVSLRGTISICRRVQDPLAELVKIDPKSIGVGQYQHDVPQKELETSLTEVVESVVNRVGVDINHASPALLSYISGISKAQAQSIYDHAQKEKIKTREEISKIKGVGPKTFEQAAGFMRIIDEPLNPLDSTGIHPESYNVVLSLLSYLKFSLADILILEKRNKLNTMLDNLDRKKFLSSQNLEIGEFTLKDIINTLKSPFRDPREDLEAPILRTNLVDMDSLEEGMELEGTVKNVTSFGAFIDIGIKINGLVHVSELANRFIDNPFEIVKPGERVKVKIISIEKERNRIGLSMKQTEEAIKNKSEGFSRKRGRNFARDVVKKNQVPQTGKFSLNDLKLSMDGKYNKRK